MHLCIFFAEWYFSHVGSTEVPSTHALGEAQAYLKAGESGKIGPGIVEVGSALGQSASQWLQSQTTWSHRKPNKVKP